MYMRILEKQKTDRQYINESKKFWFWIQVDMDSLGHRLPAASAHARHMEL